MGILANLWEVLVTYTAVWTVFVLAGSIGFVIGLGSAIAGWTPRSMRLLIYTIILYTITLEDIHLHYRFSLGHDFNAVTPLLGFLGMVIFLVTAYISWKLFRKKYPPNTLEITDEEFRKAVLYGASLYDSNQGAEE